MRLTLIQLIACCGLIACHASPPQAPAQADGGEPIYKLIDLTGEYAQFWDATRTHATGERVAAFKMKFGSLLPDFYGASRFAHIAPETIDQRIARSFEVFPSIREKYLRTARNFRSMMRPAMLTFRRTFTDFAEMPPVYLLHSLGEMDGGTRMIGGQPALVFGADVIARVHDFENEQPFLHHELFHVYHQRYFAECDEVWCGLWTEGLAVYVAHRLNPQASDSQLLLTAPEPIRPQVDAHLEEAVCAVRSRFASHDSADLRALFSFERLSEGTPPRAGYYIGYLAAQRLGASRSLVELARLQPSEVRPLLEEALSTIATCR